ncbi:metallophosphoesterase family protein [Paenibacillus sp. GCM10012307]|uniref:Metallophosphoesterase family protein n=1 Tax=Paenibacillus roseus TaxID=2798579 RepID=A0A934JBW4_9BACL|nr:metallophosphoesterase family protein [Paenibacillus roseus]MBJ6364281.1 metallophosphoesterase family protein [Paenibacillus roseus]
MDKIAVISDVHGNMPALEAVAKDLEQRGIREVICLGDLVGKGPDSDKSVDRIRLLCQTVIRGNWDDFIPNPTDNDTLEWHRRKLGVERMDYLKSLPFSVEFHMSGRLIRLFHASPRSVYERIQPWDSMEARLSLFDSSPLTSSGHPADVAGYGDIHNAYLQHVGGKTLFNTGSVGNPLEIPQASYAILEGMHGSDSPAPFNIQLIRVPYDNERAVQDAVDANMPDLDNYIREIRTARYRGLKD